MNAIDGLFMYVGAEQRQGKEKVAIVTIKIVLL
jgi:hypothetical protein